VQFNRRLASSASQRWIVSVMIAVISIPYSETKMLRGPHHPVVDLVAQVDVVAQ